MKMNQNNRIPRRIGALGLCVALSLALAACSEKSGEQTDGAAGAAKTHKQKVQTSIDRLVQFPEKDLRDGARKAVMEQRWYKPSGNNALEYYLALRQKLKAPDDSVETALVDILPYAVIGMDQAIANFDDREALRLESLIRMADPNAPALARVKADLEKMKARQAQAAAAHGKPAPLLRWPPRRLPLRHRSRRRRRRRYRPLRRRPRLRPRPFRLPRRPPSVPRSHRSARRSRRIRVKPWPRA